MIQQPDNDDSGRSLRRSFCCAKRCLPRIVLFAPLFEIVLQLSLPKLLLRFGMSSEDDNVRICESSIPSSLLVRFVPTRNEHVRTAIGKCLRLMMSTPRSSSAFLSRHEASFRATLEEIEDSGLSQLFLESLAAIMFSPDTTVLTLVCQSLDRHARRREIAASFLAGHTLLFTLAGPPDNPVMFTERLIETLSDHLSRLHSLLADSTTQPNMLVDESTIDQIRHISAFLASGLSLLDYLGKEYQPSMIEVLITQRFFSLVKSAITTCLDLPSHVANIPANQKEGLRATINSVLTMSWKIITRSLDTSMKVLHPAVESAFADGSDMFSLIECTSQQLNTNLLTSLLSHTNKGPSSSHAVFVFLKENMIERVLTRVQPTTVPLANRAFHDHLLSLISDMTRGTTPQYLTTEERPFEPLLQFNRVVVPAKRYLLFVFQRAEYLSAPSDVFVNQLSLILKHVMRLEKELHKEGKDVETGREEWEVGWLVEMTNKKTLGERLHTMEGDERMRTKEKTRWKKRAERLRQAGLDDALEAWSTPRVPFISLEHLNIAIGMNQVIRTASRYIWLWY
ncbi:hypothetical protein BLNAU_1382 [Blattamonas nauphoetae]|uniref:Uncharacterized protein n=1 Tax=Blattamonas nauphoetae TaxID=2049346 RepID=A0ABQ9YJ84_9EUKA|nr:hypothetical protein BLNAU_1382 [Blattamonas nauphoetae]